MAVSTHNHRISIKFSKDLWQLVWSIANYERCSVSSLCERLVERQVRAYCQNEPVRDRIERVRQAAMKKGIFGDQQT